MSPLLLLTLRVLLRNRVMTSGKHSRFEEQGQKKKKKEHNAHNFGSQVGTKAWFGSKEGSFEHVLVPARAFWLSRENLKTFHLL